MNVRGLGSGMNQLRKLLQAATATVIILTVGLSNVWAGEVRTKLPKCKGVNSAKWNNCYGKQEFINGSYEGEFRSGMYDGFGKLDTDGEKYEGEFKNMLKYGKGKWWSQSDYAGTLIEGKKNPHDYYEGDFKDGFKDGAGVYVNKYGDRYEGQFKNDKENGQGTLTSDFGWKYVGSWKNGVEHGNGTEFRSNSKLTGTWLNGEKNGFFETDDFTDLRDSVRITENYKNDRLHGKQTMYDVGGAIISIANYVDGIEHGMKYAKLPDLGEMFFYMGAGKPLGIGFLNEPNGDKRFTVYEEGELLFHGIKDLNENFYLLRHITKKKFIPLSDQAAGLEKIKLIIKNLSASQIENFLVVFKECGNKFDRGVIGLLGVQTKNILNERLDFKVDKSRVNDDGVMEISVRAQSEIVSLKINGEEQGGCSDGNYNVEKVARAGGDTQFTVVATDVHGNTETKTITVSRPLADSKPLVAALNPAQVKQQPSNDAVAIIIGIAEYKNLPRADYANDDARVFYDYAVRALGVKPENIKLLVDTDADEVGIYRAFKTWSPSQVQATTDVYVYYSGHGLPTADGRGLYLLPQRADRDFIDKTAITQAEINTASQAAKPRSVTIFLDACYSGQARTGETLLASARPVALKVERQLFPDSFTVISASQADQIPSSSPDLKHGIFSYYLMRGMEGAADANRDGKITAGEMHQYLTEQVARQAGMMNRQQVPQLTGDADRVLVGR